MKKRVEQDGGKKRERETNERGRSSALFCGIFRFLFNIYVLVVPSFLRKYQKIKNHF